MKDKRIEMCLIVVVAMLFFFSAIAPMVIGYNAEPTEIDKNLMDLRFMCTEPSGFNEMKYEYYKEQLLTQNSDENLDEYKLSDSKELITLLNPPLIMTSSNGPMNSPWPVKCHDTHHTGQSPYSTANTTSLEKWRFYFSDWLEDSPVIDSDGTIYCKGGYNILDHLYAIYPDGTEKWKYKTNGLIWGSSPAISEDGTIYVGAWDDYLYAINSNGTKNWRFNANGANIASSPAIAEDGTIYFGTLWSLGDGGKIHAVNPNGSEKWRYQTGDAITSDPAIGDDGTIYIGSCDTYLYAMNPNGTLKWRFKTGDEIHGHPSIDDDGTIYIASFDHYLYALNPNGTLKWKRGSDYSGCSSVAIGEDGTLYFGSLIAAYPDNGTTKWSIDIPNIDHSSLALSADGTIYAGAGKYIIAIDLNNGTERWRKKIAEEWVESSPIIADDGTIYIGSSCNYGRGYLHAFGTVESNSPPSAPTITGETNGKVGEEYWYRISAVDPDNNPIQLYVDWDDGNSGWVGEYASGEEIWQEHEWSSKGTYKVKAKVKDVMGEESGWGYLEVTMPKNKQSASSQPLLLQFLRRFSGCSTGVSDTQRSDDVPWFHQLS